MWWLPSLIDAIKENHPLDQTIRSLQNDSVALVAFCCPVWHALLLNHLVAWSEGEAGYRHMRNLWERSFTSLHQLKDKAPHARARINTRAQETKRVCLDEKRANLKEEKRWTRCIIIKLIALSSDLIMWSASSRMTKESAFFSLHWSKTYLSDEGPVLLHLMVVVMATSQELPNLPAESLRDATTHQSWELPGTNWQVHVPERRGENKIYQ